MTVGNRLRAIRAELGLSQKAMAQHFGLGESGWKDFELRDRAPKGEVLAKLVDMGFSSDWILTGEGEMRRVGDPVVAGRLREIRRLMEGETLPLSGHAIAANPALPGVRAELTEIATREGLFSGQRMEADRLLELAFADEAARMRRIAGETKLFNAFGPSTARPNVVDGSGPLDEDLLAWCVQALDEALAERRRTLAPDKKATAISLLYRLGRAGEARDRRMVLRLLDLTGS